MKRASVVAGASRLPRRYAASLQDGLYIHKDIYDRRSADRLARIERPLIPLQENLRIHLARVLH